MSNVVNTWLELLNAMNKDGDGDGDDESSAYNDSNPKQCVGRLQTDVCVCLSVFVCVSF